MQLGIIKVSAKCKRWSAEAGGYVWDDDPGEDRPVKENDHDMDSTRYFVRTKRLIKRHGEPEYKPLWN
jgi:hypothetical protein